MTSTHFLSESVLTIGVHHRLVYCQVYAEVPPRVEYFLTEIGQRLGLIIDAMWKWGKEYKAKIRCNELEAVEGFSIYLKTQLGKLHRFDWRF